ncbi:hypothetical protein QW131_03450 [Roseibium salinum]|nr:hypothetical protein [Roseibium salinum]
MKNCANTERKTDRRHHAEVDELHRHIDRRQGQRHGRHGDDHRIQNEYGRALLGAKLAHQDGGKRTCQCGNERGRMPRRQFRHSGPQNDQNTDQTDEDGRPALNAHLFSEQRHGERRDQQGHCEKAGHRPRPAAEM